VIIERFINGEFDLRNMWWKRLDTDVRWAIKAVGYLLILTLVSVVLTAIVTFNFEIAGYERVIGFIPLIFALIILGTYVFKKKESYGKKANRNLIRFYFKLSILVGAVAILFELPNLFVTFVPGTASFLPLLEFTSSTFATIFLYLPFFILLFFYFFMSVIVLLRAIRGRMNKLVYVLPIFVLSAELFSEVLLPLIKSAIALGYANIFSAVYDFSLNLFLIVFAYYLLKKFK